MQNIYEFLQKSSKVVSLVTESFLVVAWTQRGWLAVGVVAWMQGVWLHGCRGWLAVGVVAWTQGMVSSRCGCMDAEDG